MGEVVSDEREFDLTGKTVIYIGIGLAVACAALFALYYLQHPDRSIFEDLAYKTRRIPPSADVAAAEAAEREAREHE
jgi:hypothetical protein